MPTEQFTFRALADPTRRQILRLLNSQDMTIGELTEQFPMTRAAVKKHLGILEEGELVNVEIKGRERINRLQRDAFAVVTEWMEGFEAPAEDRLAALRRSVAKEWG